ncbi:helix-turn-helix domain-containing protein [Sphingobium sp. V4]|uniref:helix-turn-helix domain-containing protein n=1 Tax=Sphingobium sp. V4 TaxID=3038927 RepID=UPI0025583A62|nr:helix-turn-helix domain-containing protein [Sphingobium sp. V4]WIW89313.1 helix-turn-helix domain-containing protein [Sphingobium sp. V4]
MSEIKAIRDSLGLTQAQLAVKLGVTQSSVSRFETGEIIPDRRTILAMQALQASTAPASDGEQLASTEEAGGPS